MNIFIAGPRVAVTRGCASLAMPARLQPWLHARTSAACINKGNSFSQPQRRVECTHTKPPTGGKACASGGAAQKRQSQVPLSSPEFWSSRATWRRAGVNTLRCLVGCTAGDFSAMWYLQAFHPDLGVGAIMALSMASGLATSFTLETVLLRLGRDALPSWREAARTAAGMSLLSMITMEAAENLVDWHMTGGVVRLDDPWFWFAATVSLGAGFLAPLPWNYYKLRRFGKACH